MNSLSFLHAIFFFIVAIGILVSFHEFGHFWVARKLGVRVLRFSVGFGKVLWRYQKMPETTEYVLAAIPLGGYVKMLDERMEPVAVPDLPYAFNRQPLSSRIAIVLAGPVFNLVLAIILYWFVFMVGDVGVRPVIGTPEQTTLAAQAGFIDGDEILAIDGKTTPIWSEVMTTLFASALDGKQSMQLVVKDSYGQENIRVLEFPEQMDIDQEVFYQRLGFKIWSPTLAPVIGNVLEQGAALAADLQVNDLIVSVDGIAINSWTQWVKIIQKSPDITLDLVVDRGGVYLDLPITPKGIETEQGIQGRIGAAVDVPEGMIRNDMYVEYSLPPWQALHSACAWTYQYSFTALKMMGHMLIGNVSVDNLSGPITIAQYASKTADLGWVFFLKFLAAISVSLGVLNLLPIPVLDGGHLMFYLIEAIKGSPVSEKVQSLFQKVGLSLLISLMILVFYLDLERLFS